MNKTQKLYDLYPYGTEFDAKILSVTKNDRLFAVICDKTLFFPEEGGQACDRGTLCGIPVEHVSISDGVITHYLAEAPGDTESAHGVIDFDFRFRNMQNHSGEHIVSGLIYKHFGFSNVGFHLGSDDVTMDYDGVLTREMLDNIEELANAAVYRNIPIEAGYPDADILSTLSYRSKKEIDGDVRIVTIGDIDTCACCAPHVATTAEIGIIKLLDFAKYKGGTRVHMHCGHDALIDYRKIYSGASEIAKSLSTNRYELPYAVKKLEEEILSLKRSLSELSSTFAESVANSVEPTDGAILRFESCLDSASMRKMTNILVGKCGYCAVFSGDDVKGYSFIIASRERSAKEILSKLSETISVKGGGSDSMVQGTTDGVRSDIEKAFI